MDDEFQRSALRWLGQLLDAEPASRGAIWQALAAEGGGEALSGYVAHLWQLHQRPEFTRALLDRMDRAFEPDSAHDGGALEGDQIGKYQLTELLATGGMGQVWRAVRVEDGFKHEVAIKLPKHFIRSHAQIARFERERDLLAMLSYPLIARLYDAGVTPSGQPYIVLEYVRGRAITEACDELSMPVPERLRLFLQVLEAVGYAHRLLIIHRDIKPSNVLVNDEGQVKLLDFGIAKLLPDQDLPADPTEQTKEGRMAFTPRYAAPEQRQQGPTSTATDVHALGLLLYELLTGQLPDDGAREPDEAQRPSALQLDEAFASQRGTVRSRLRAALRGDLDTIILKAIRPNPSDRYSSVDRFAEDIQRHLSNRPIVARRPSMRYRAGLFIRRHRQSLGIGALGLGAAAVLAGSLGLQALRTGEERARAQGLRDFMLDLVEDADPYEVQDDATPDSVQLLNSGERRVRQRFDSDPRMVGELLSAFGRMYQRLDRPAEGERVLEDSLALLVAHAQAGDPALGKARTLVAEVGLAKGDIDRARQLAELALQGCIARDRECAKVRGYANVDLGIVYERRGDEAKSLAHFEASVKEMELGFGPDHAETAMAWCQLAVRQRNFEHLQEASTSIGMASDIAEGALLRARGAAEITRTRALIDLDLGRFHDAQRALAALVPKTRAKAERIIQLRLLAYSEIALGHGRAAMAAADNALALVDPDPTKVDHIFSRQVRALASEQLQDFGAAADELRQVAVGLQKLGFSSSSMVMLRARRFLAEVLARQGRLEEADSILSDVLRIHGKNAAPQRIEWAQALDLGGAVRRNLGRFAEARGLHDHALAKWAVAVPADHPALLRNALYRALAGALADGQGAEAGRLADSARKYEAIFDSESSWAATLRSWKEPLRCNGDAKPECSFIF